MRIEISVAGPAGVHDVAVVAPGSSRIGDVTGLLARAAGGRADSRLSVDGRPIDPAAPLAALRTGTVVVVAAPGADPPPPPSATRELRFVGGSRAGSVLPLPRGTVTIGRGPGNAVQADGPGVSRRHASLEVSASATTLHDHDSTNGTWLDGERVVAPVRLRGGQLIRIGESLLEVAEVPADAPTGALRSAAPTLVHRAPRAAHDVAASVVDIPEATEPSRPGRVQWLTATLPAVLGAGMALVLDSPQFLLFALLSPVMVLSGALGDRVHWRRSRRRAVTRHREQLDVASAQIAAGLAAETRRRRTSAPDPTAVARIATTLGPRLWERQRGDGDHLGVRIGSAGRAAELTTRTGATACSAGTVADVPVTVDLRAGPIGIAGPPRAADAVARWLVLQLAVLQSPTDVEFVLLLGAPNESWHWARWLPQLRTVALDAESCTEVIESLTREHAGRHAPSRRDESWQGRWTVVLADATALGCGGMSELLAAPSATGTTAVCVSDRVDHLPAQCVALVSGHDPTGRTTVRSAAFTGAVVPDEVSSDWAERIARAMAPLTDSGAGADAGALPAHCHLSDLLGTEPPDTVAAARARWRAADGGAATAVGVTMGTTGAETLTLDLVADGPHALVVGTTGSGKSELLRTLVTGLAARYPPDAITFLLVDYKGGAAFAGCAAFPHTAAVVTDLDATLTRRALRSLHAELRRREGVLADAGVADIAAYRSRHGPGAIPRLVIVVDEFAELAAELPEFVDGLVGVARRGRSLGVHLVLATQRPGGAVSAEIRANTSLRVALRVTNMTDSADVLGTPDAAHVDPALPGRGWARTSAGVIRFQTAQAAGSDRPPATPTLLPLPRWRRPADPVHHGRSLRDGDELVAMADVFTAAARVGGHRPAARPWQPPLPEFLALAEVTSRENVAAAVGLVDLPDEQTQPVLTIDLERERSIVIAGRSASGRTSALTSAVLACAERATPDELEVYAIDASGDLAAALGCLPHVATCLGPGDLELVPRLLDRIVERVERHGRARTAARVFLVVDGWDRVLTGLDELTAARCSEALHRLGRAGAGARATVVVAGDRDVLTPRLGSPGFGTKYVLDLADRTDYGLAGLAVRDVPDALPPGRAVRASDSAVVQFAHPGDRCGPAAVLAAARAVAARYSGHRSAGAVRLTRLPDAVRLAAMSPSTGAAIRLGVAGDGADPLAVDLVAHGARLLVAGPPRSGRTTALLAVLAEALRCGVHLLVAATTRSPLRTAAMERGIDVIGPDAEWAQARGQLLLIDDVEEFGDGPAADRLTGWLERTGAAAVVAGRSDELATAFRGPAALVRRHRCGILLRPGRLDGELLGVAPGAFATHGAARTGGPPAPPGRGVVVGDPRWGPLFATGLPVPIQVAAP